MVIAIPIRARTGVKEVGFKSCINILSLEIPPRLRIHEVMVVPILAPIIMPMDCLSVIMPEFTKPTTITVVAEELCITAVTPIPVIKALSLLPVSLPKSPLRLPPARLSRDSPIKFIPKRNKHKPPINSNTSKMSMFHPVKYSFYSFQYILKIT